MPYIQEIANSPIFSWIILPLLIFLARICDVTMGTIRIIFVSRGKRFGAVLGFLKCPSGFWQSARLCSISIMLSASPHTQQDSQWGIS